MSVSASFFVRIPSVRMKISEKTTAKRVKMPIMLRT